MDAPDDEVATTPPGPIADGALSALFVGSNQLLSRLQAAHPALFSQIALALSVSARVTGDSGASAASGPVIVRQDTIDAMREEYIELNISRGVPARSEFIPVAPNSANNRGDYTFEILMPAFISKLQALRAAFNHPLWQENVIYRSAAHNRYHADLGGGGGVSSGVDLNSWHQYGCAADLQTFPAPRTNATLTQQALAYWNDLAALARDQGFRVEALVARNSALGSGVGHVHVHFCPR